MHYPNKKLKVYIYQEPIDMRYSFNKLTAYIVDDYSMETLLEGHAFVFFGKNRYRLKVLIYDGSGLVLLIKRIEVGKFMWVHDLDTEQVTHKEFNQLVHGSVLRKGRLGEMP